MFDSMLTRSTTVGVLMACLRDERAPLMDWIAECKKDGFKVSALTSPPTRLEPFSNAAYLAEG